MVLREDIQRLAGRRREFAIFTKPARQKGLGSFRNPLLEQCGNFFAQIGGVIETRKLETFERRLGSLTKIIPRWNDTAAGHDCEPPKRESPMRATVSTTYNTVPYISNVFTLDLWKFVQETV